ncbi:FkbM family methyltransferase [Phenylobacterium sp.]|jgi:FkbM family methyltransferase|uniref:FkbM family methyltransferase n=1 Tax=Phenylobacterium sp. TaxID=1871053 RepID=UPI002E325691|nr:FkbM family methyltransferase [Phenylobacterium sp.]HEX3367161.1 FkbM family methyltransferase [Phenylobacterium sp.]
MDATDTKTLNTRHGPMIGLATDRYITRSLEVYGEYCPEEWRLLAQVVKPGMAVVEVGANIGTHSVPLARACAPGPLYLFEPQQRVFQILCANLALNGVENAIAYPEACTDTEGYLIVPTIDYARAGNFGGVAMQAEGAGVAGLRTRAVALDSLELAACHVIKIDVEGFEAQVLRGAARTIARCRPILYVENDRLDRQEALARQVAEMGYRLYWHLPRLFDPGNFNGHPEDVFGNVRSLNMFCIPVERKITVVDMRPIDLDNWQPVGRPRVQ